MVEGVLVCGTFLTKRALMVISSLLLLVLILGGISLGFGLAMSCGYSNDGYQYYDSCSNTKLSLLINGGVLVGFTAIGLFVIAVLFCKVKKSPMTVQQNMVTQPYSVMPAYAQGNATYPATNPTTPHQLQVNPSMAAGVNRAQYQQTQMSEHQKADPEAAPSSNRPPF